MFVICNFPLGNPLMILALLKVNSGAKLATAGSTVFENYRKSLIQHCERSELRFYFDSVTRDVNFNKTKIGGNAKIQKDEMRHFE